MSGDLHRAEVQPFPKATQLARKERRYRRKVASPKQWAAIHASKQGPCRCCGAPPPNTLHHVIPRDRFGDDVAENLVPVCWSCHDLIERRDPAACRTLVESLWRDGQEPGPRGGPTDEYSYAAAKDERFAESIYGVFARPVGSAA